MGPFGISGLLAGISALAFGLLVLLRTENQRLGRIWFVFSLSVAVYGFGVFWADLAKTAESGFWAWRLMYMLGVVWIPVLFYWFMRAYLGLAPNVNPSIKLHFAVATIFFFLIPTRFYFARLRWVFGSMYYALGQSPLFLIYFVWWTSLVFYSHYLLCREYPALSRQKKSQVKYFMTATVIGFTGGSLSYLPNFGIDIYPWGNFTVFLYPLIMSYAILKYQLMDIRLFIRRTVVLVAVYCALLFVSAPFMILLHRKVASAAVSSSFLVIEIVSLSAVLSMGPFLYAYFVRRSFWLRNTLSTGLAHELKSPLGAIQGAVEVMRDQLKSPSLDPAKTAQYVDMVEKNAARLETYIKDLLDIAKIQEDNVSIDKKPADFGQMLHETAARLQPQAMQKGLEIHINSALSCPVLMDTEKIEQVISNLLSNAIRYSDKGTIMVHAENGGREIRCSVTDQGRGVPRQHLERIFDRFFQSSKSSKGSGLGLAIAKAWVEAHGGKIWAESEGEGKGTKVTFTLPIR